MKEAIGWFVVLALLAVSLSFVGCAKQEEKKPATTPVPEKAAAPKAVQKQTQSLFFIEHSKDANVVQYDARLTADGNLDPKEPVIVYWVIRAEDGHREELNWLEKKKGYGFDIKPDPSVNGYKMILKGDPQHPITVKREGEAVRAEVVIGGRQAVLEKIYINASDGLMGPKVHDIVLYGKDLKTGGKRSQKIVQK
jgi:predicted small lipoprotein YifL